MFGGIIGSIKSCYRRVVNYTRQVRLKWRFIWLAIPVALALVGAGCSGINASGGVSPASFFLPGIMRADPPATTNAPVAVSGPSNQLALAR
jgi:hypothetical protein